MRRTIVLTAGRACAALGIATVVAWGCSSSNDSGGSKYNIGDGSAGSSGGSSGASSGASGDGASGDGNTGLNIGCTTLSMCQVSCKDGGPTSLSGTVYDPAGKVPLYNVVVYIPTTAVQPITSGASCDQCGGEVTGNPLGGVTALTDAKGQFVLNNVPANIQFTLVMQLGKWRRQVMVQPLTACQNTAIMDKTLRLPRNHSEGDIPRIAVTTGGADPLECLLRKVGIDDSEFSTAGGTGRVHLYAGTGVSTATPPLVATSSFATSLNSGATLADAQTLWGSATNLEAYDIVLMACEGAQNAATKPSSALSAMATFENAGGRVFMSHWHDYWIESGPGTLPMTGTWTDFDPNYMPPPDPYPGTIDTSFPKGQAFHDWLSNNSALDSNGQLDIHQPKANQAAVGNGAQQWVTLANPNSTPAGKTAIEYMSFNTPLDVDAGSQCGRVVYSDLHVSAGVTNDAGVPVGDRTGQPFPSGCVTTDLSPQEKALEFMLFDLSSCIQSDSMPPQPPM